MSRCAVFFVLLGLLTAAMPLEAMPPHPELLERIENGEILMPYALEHRSELMARGVDNPEEITPYGSNGLDEIEYNTLLLLLDFSDNVQHVEALFFDSLMYGSTFGTVKHYYQNVSYGEFEVVSQNYPSTIGWLRMPQTYAWYVDGQNGYGNYPQNVQGMVVDAINAVDDFVDFSDYDNSGNGFVDGLMIVHAGRGAEYTGSDDMIWSHSWVIPQQERDGVTIRRYIIQPEYWSNYGDMTCGVYAHEMGHMIFGLPDLYDTDYSSNGVGRWSLMAGGSWNGTLGGSPAAPDAWSRFQMGFADPIDVVTNGLIDFPAVATSPSIFRLQSAAMHPSQYFLVENRQQTSYDSALPSHGLLLWHVDETVNTGNTSEWYPGHEHAGHFLVALEQADGQWDLERNVNSGDSGDPFPGSLNRTAFDALSLPSSDDYNGNPTFVGVVNISASSPLMSAHVLTSPLPAPFNLAWEVDPETGEVTLSWEVDPGAGQPLHYMVYRDGAVRGEPETASFTDTLPEMEVQYTYSVSAVWSGGESIYNPEVVTWWPGPLAPQMLRFEVLDIDSREIRLHWNQWRNESLIVDDGTWEQNTYLNGTVPGGAKIAQRLTAPAAGFVHGIRVFLNENSSFPLGQIRLHLFTNQDDLPGEAVYSSPVFVPDTTGWLDYSLEDQALQMSEGGEIWAVLEWVQTGHTMVARDLDSPRQGRGAISVNGETWVHLDDFQNGLIPGNLSIRIEYGRNEAIGEMGLEQFEVYRDSELIGTVSDQHYTDTLPVEALYEYQVVALYLQGEAASELLPVDGTNLDVPEHSAQPFAFAVGHAYPNPFNPSVAVSVTLGRTSDVRMTVFDILGREVAAMQRNRLTPGQHLLNWTADGHASGVYFLRVEAGKHADVRKVVLMR